MTGNEDKIDPDFITIFLNILSGLSSVAGIGMAVKSLAKESKVSNVAADISFKSNAEKVRRALRDVQDSFGYYTHLIEDLANDSETKFFSERFKADVSLIFTRAEMKTYVDIKRSLDQSICQMTIFLNGILQTVVNHNPTLANVFIELVDEIQNGINSILLEEKSFREATTIINNLIEQVSRTLQRLRGNR